MTMVIRPSALAFQLLVLVAASFAGAAETAPLIDTAIDQCIRIVLPNSHAITGDVEAVLARREEEYRESVLAIVGADALGDLQRRLSEEQDELRIYCLLDIAGRTGLDDAIEMLVPYRGSELPGVSGMVSRHLRNLDELSSNPEFQPPSGG
jgi:hypothetical protein